MAVAGLYISWRIRQMVLPFVRVYGQWVEEHIIPMSDQLEKMANTVEQEAYDNLMSQPVGDDYSGDGSDEAEAALDIGLSFYKDISKMYQATLNLFSAGLMQPECICVRMFVPTIVAVIRTATANTSTA